MNLISGAKYITIWGWVYELIAIRPRRQDIFLHCHRLLIYIWFSFWKAHLLQWELLGGRVGQKTGTLGLRMPWVCVGQEFWRLALIRSCRLTWVLRVTLSSCSPRDFEQDFTLSPPFLMQQNTSVTTKWCMFKDLAHKRGSVHLVLIW